MSILDEEKRCADEVGLPSYYKGKIEGAIWGVVSTSPALLMLGSSPLKACAFVTVQSAFLAGLSYLEGAAQRRAQHGASKAPGSPEP